MGKQKVKITKITRKKTNKVGKGYRQCNMCHGTGKIKV